MNTNAGTGADLAEAYQAGRTAGHAAPVERRPRSSPSLRAAQLLHWLTAGLIAILMISGVAMKQIGGGALADQLFTFHKTAGFLVFVLVLARLLNRLWHRVSTRWRRLSWHPVHALLYALLVLVPFLGLAGISDFGARGVYFGLSLPAVWPHGAGYASGLFTAHAWLAFGLMALVVLHIGVALGDYLHRGAQRDQQANAGGA